MKDNITRLDYSKENYNKTGVYSITNLKNNKKYIGISQVSINKRYLSHIHRLRNDNHVNIHLQASYNKYGFKNFQFEILEIIPKDNIELLKEREIYYITKFNSYKNGYNRTEGGDFNNQYKLVYAYKTIRTKDKIYFEFYKEYKGARETARGLNYSESHIYEVIRGTRRAIKIKDYIFLEEEEKKNIIDLNDYLLEKYNKIQNLPKKGHAIKNFKLTPAQLKKATDTNKKKLYHFDLDGNFIKVWDSINEASEFLGVHASNISKVLKGKQNSTANSIFKLASDIPSDLLNKYNSDTEEKDLSKFKKNKKEKAINMFDLSNNFVKRFNSSKECAIYLGVARPNISACLSGRQKTVKGHVFKYC